MDWKINLLSFLDPRFEVLLQSAEETSRIDLTELVWGGVVVDGIPDLQFPPIIPPSEADFLRPHERGFGASINGEHRAYPLRILNPHEMANDVFGGEPIALAYRTLCGTGIVYSAKIEGEPITFGTSVLLYRSNKVMCDQATLGPWHQFTGKPIIGPLADSGIKLSFFPVNLTTWDEWYAEHPDTTGLSLKTGVYLPGIYMPSEDRRSAYNDYISSLGSQSGFAVTTCLPRR